MRALVTGGAGFIGSAIVARLLREGHQVRVLDDLSSGSWTNLADHHSAPEGAQAELIEASVDDFQAVRRSMDGVQAVVHLAALVSVPSSIESPQRCYQVNLNGSLNVLVAAREASAERVVLASSAAVYGEAGGRVSEASPVQPLSPYAASKLAMEAAARLYNDRLGLETVCLRYFNVYGPNQRPDSQYAAVVPAFIRAVLDGAPMHIHGDGSQSRDFIHVTDVARATVMAATSPGIGGGVLNIGSGRSVTVANLAEILQDLVPEMREPVHEPPRPGDIHFSVADIGRAQQVMGFEAETGLPPGLIETLEWARDAWETAIEG